MLGKSTYELHDRLEGAAGHASAKVAALLTGRPGHNVEPVLVPGRQPFDGRVSRGESVPTPSPMTITYK
jgi:hypothetical protein